MTVVDIQRTLHRIITTSEAIKSKVVTSLADDTKLNATYVAFNTHDAASLSLPSYPPILDTLVEDGIPEELSKRLSTAVTLATDGLKERTEAKFRETWKEIAFKPCHRDAEISSLIDIENQLRRAFEVVFWRKCEAWAEDVRKRAIARQRLIMDNDTLSDDNSRQHLFNHVRSSFPSKLLEFGADVVLLELSTRTGSILSSR